MEILYRDKSVLVCRKDPGLLSTDEPGGVPEALRRLLGDEKAELRTVHRLDRVVGGLMVLGCSAAASLRDLMWRDKARKMSFVVEAPGKDVQEALLDFRRLDTAEGLSLVRVRLHTGRSHQIRCQFASHGWPLAGERKYDTREDPWPLALWSCYLAFTHPESGERPTFSLQPPSAEPWTFFAPDALLSGQWLVDSESR